jgi:hypothetical protein
MAWVELLELGQELLPGFVVVVQGFDGDPALGEQVVERGGAVRLFHAYELAGRPERIGDLQPAAAQPSRAHRVLVKQHVPVLLGDFLVVPVSSCFSPPPELVHGGSVTLAGRARSSAILDSTVARYSTPISYHWPCQ